MSSLISKVPKVSILYVVFFSEWISDQLNISWTILSSLLGEFAVALLLHPPKNDDKMFKKCSTDQRFIGKRNTTYKIHTLAVSMRKNQYKFQNTAFLPKY